jgi:PAS domain S-box-containing protein
VGFAEAKTAEEACAVAAEVLGRHSKDVPFALLYLVAPDGATGTLAAAVGVAPGDEAAPPVVSLERDGQRGWPAAAAFRGERTERVDDLAAHFSPVPPGPWSDPPRQALVMPIPSNVQHRPAGLLVLGLSARIALDDAYVAFAELVGAQIATAIAHARAYEEERQRAEALAEIDRAKTAFFSNVSHEFRTPLTLLLGPLEEARAIREREPGADVSEDLAVAHRNGLRLLKLVNTLLDFSRIEAGRVEAVYEPVDLAAVTAELAGSFRSAVERAGLALRVDATPLPEPVYVDRDMWEKIVLNLISNAFKHTFEGEIAVTLRAEDGAAVLEVRDSGVGMPAEQLPHVFERFHRVPNARSRTHEGTGIGLALVQELARLHGGRVDVESREGIGSAFTVRIPLGTGHLPADRIATIRQREPTSVGAAPFVEEALRWLPGGSRLADTAELPVARERRSGPIAVAEVRARVLVADDNADMRAYAQRLLGARWEVDLVPDGLTALERIRESPPDLVLTDVMMPGLDGFELLRAIRSDPATRALPVILLSARAGEESRVEGLDAGADDYLVKPFSARELLAKVGATIELSRARREAAAAIAASEEIARRRTEQFESLLAAAPIGLYLVDDEFKIREANPTALAAFGEIPGLIGRDFAEVMHVLWPRHYADEVVRLFRHTLETGEPYSTPEHIEQRLDRGVTEYYEWWINRIPLTEGRSGVVCWFRDISAQVAARAAVAESQARLRQAAKMEAVGRLAGGLAHDFNNQLQALLGYTRYASMDAGISARGQQDLEQVQKAGWRLADLTAQLLAFSRQQVLRPELLDMDAAVAEALELLRRLIDNRIDFQVVHEAGAKWVHADRTQVQQVLMNLCINARDAMPDGGRIEVRTAVRSLDRALPAPNSGTTVPPGRYVELVVTDTGEGIPPEHLTHIFEPFFTTKEVGKGTGLGLATVHGIVTQSQGYVYAETGAGEGARFTVLLPAAAPPAGANAAGGNGADLAASAPTVLLVEDEDSVRGVLARILVDEGFRVLQARHGREALALLAEYGEKIGLVLTDLAMPVMAGKELAARIANSYPGLPLVIMSGHPSEAAGESADNEREYPFLAKPVGPEVLVATVREAIGRTEGR